MRLHILYEVYVIGNSMEYNVLKGYYVAICNIFAVISAVVWLNAFLLVYEMRGRMIL